MSDLFSHSTHSPLTLLIIDDEMEVLKATSQYLTTTYQFQTDKASSGFEALSMIVKNHYDAIVCDYEMEGMSGIEILKTIRSQGNNTPFIMFTGKGREEVVVSSFECGADGYVMKGGEIRSQFAELAHKIVDIVQKRRTEKELQEIEEQFQDIYYNSPIAIELYNEHGIITDINPACCELFGIQSVHSVRGFNLFDDPNIPKSHLDGLKNGKAIRYKSDFDFDLVKQQNLYFTSRSGTINLDILITPMYKGDHLLSGYLVQIVDITDQTQSHIHLEEQKRFLDRLLETIPSPIYYKDTSGRYTGCNSAFEQYIGLSKPDIIGKTVFDISPDELAVFLDAKDKELYDNPGVQTYESQLQFADGALHDVYFQKVALLDLTGQVQGLIGIILDLSARKKVEEALRESEASLKALMNSTSESALLIDTNGIILTANSIVAMRVGHSLDEIIGRDALTFIPPDLAASRRERIETVIRTKEPIQFEDTRSDRIFENNVYPVLDDNGAVIRCAIFGRDITDERDIQKALQESEKRYRDLFEYNKAVMLVIDPESARIIDANRAASEYYGYSPEELTNLLITDINVAKPDLIKEKINQAKEQNGTFFQFLHRKKSGEIRDVEVFSAPVLIDGRRHLHSIIQDVTERKRVEKALLESEQFLADVFASIQDGISILDKNLRVVRVNATMERWYAYQGSLIGRFCYEVYHGATSRCDLCPSHQTLTTGQTAVEIVPKLGKDNTITGWLEVYSYPLVEMRSGEMTGVIEYVRDISERRFAEDALKLAKENLQKSENHYRLLAEQIIDVVWILDPETGYFLYVSPSVERLRGYTAEEVLEKSAFDALTPESAKMVKEGIQTRVDRFLSGDEAPPFYREEIEQPCKDGSKVWTEVITNYYLSEETGRVAVRGVTRDITKRKEAERRIKQSEAALRTVLDSIGDAIFIHDITGHILDYNAQVLRMFQISDPDQVKQGSFTEDYSAPDNPVDLLPNSWWEVMRGNNQFFEWKSRRPSDESVFDTDIYMTRIDLPKGPAILVSVHDNTERKRAQYALEQANKKLNLLSSITRHDILNSLTGMLGYLEFVKEITTDDKVSSLITKIDTLARTIKNQIDFTRDYQDMGAAIVEWQDVSKVFDKATLLRNDGKITFKIDLNGLSIYADPMLEKVIFNLIDNAIRHGEQVTEIRSYWNEEKAGVTWVFEDNGVGIPDNMKEPIFRRGVGKNTGLGLFLVREILSITGIMIREVGREGEGARFEIAVPKGAYRHVDMSDHTEIVLPIPSQDLSLPISTNLPDLIYRHLERMMPEVISQYSEQQRIQCQLDIKSHLDHLDAAVWADSKGLFIAYVNWVRTLFQGMGLTDEWLLAGLNAIKAAVKEVGKNSGIPYLDEAILCIQKPEVNQSSWIREDNPHYELADQFLQSILTRNKVRALTLIQDEIYRGTSLQSLYLLVFQPVLYENGRLWHTNQISVGDEHFCTAAIEQIMAQFYLQVHDTPKTGKKVLALCVSGELHEVGLRIVADFFEMSGWDSIYLGSNVPSSSITTIIREENQPLLAISCTMTCHLYQVAELIQMIRSDVTIKDTKIMVGGSPFMIDDQLWRRVGADAYARDAAEAVLIGERLIISPHN